MVKIIRDKKVKIYKKETEHPEKHLTRLFKKLRQDMMSELLGLIH